VEETKTQALGRRAWPDTCSWDAISSRENSGTDSGYGGITPLLMARISGRIPVVNACRTRDIEVCVIGHHRFLHSQPHGRFPFIVEPALAVASRSQQSSYPTRPWSAEPYPIAEVMILCSSRRAS
jgi:hypothetical protein